MSIFNEYLTGYERELAIEESTHETEMSKLFTMLEMVELQYNQMIKDAELKVLVESGTYDDLAYLITEADAEAGKQQQGIFASIISAIGRLFASIGEKVQKLLGIGNADVIVEAPANTKEKQTAIGNCLTGIQNGIEQIRKNGWSGAVDAFKSFHIPEILTAAGAAAGGAVVMKKYKKGELDGIINWVNGKLADLRKTLEEIQKKASEGDTIGDKIKSEAIKLGLGALDKLGKAISSFTGSLSSLIMQAVEKAKGLVNGKDKQEAQPAEGENKSEQNTAGVEEQPEVKLDEKSAKTKQRYRLLSNGQWEMFDKQIKTWKKIPTPPADLAEKAKQLTQESSVENLQAIFGSNYIVEKTDDGFVFTENEEEIAESVSRSIFGYDLENEEVLHESADAFDKELEELSAIFSTL